MKIRWRLPVPTTSATRRKIFAVFETGNTAAVADGAEATAENLYYSRATEWGDFWDEVLLVPERQQSHDPWMPRDR